MADGYRVQPDAVQAVLGDTAVAGSAIAKAARPLSAALKEAGGAADGTAGAGLISAALQALEADVAHGMAVITTRLPAASHGLRNATEAVIAGDQEMAGQIHSEASGSFQPPAGNGRWMR